MLVKYYRNNDLVYSNRKRYKYFNYTSFFEEEQKSILFGDGAETQIKTNINNICDYVVIDNTRWFVTSYIYNNGGQVTLFLQRDVVGEFGIDNVFGKVERGYTNSFLKYRKELNLNEILKDRKKIVPNTNTYGNFSVDNHNDELWGILYFSKPTGVDPSTGEKFPDKLNINIPGFSPAYVTYPSLNNGSVFFSEKKNSVFYDIKVLCDLNATGIVNNEYTTQKRSVIYSTKTTFGYSNGAWYYYISKSIIDPDYTVSGSQRLNDKLLIACNWDTTVDFVPFEKPSIALADIVVNDFLSEFAINNINQNSEGFIFPIIPVMNIETIDYTNKIVKEGDSFYEYTSNSSDYSYFGRVNTRNFVENFNFSYYKELEYGNGAIIHAEIGGAYGFESQYQNAIILNTEIIFLRKLYSKRLLDSVESGSIIIDSSAQLVDEPYSILVFPLYNVKITGSGGNFDIQKSSAFMIFNTVIQYLSGDNPYLIDAQIFPYCPILTDIGSVLQNYPFFKIASNTYNHKCFISLTPLSDVKKEYIERSYSIISPEQSGKFNFNFYDYKLEKNSDLTIIIKTALKPFAIVSSAVIIPDSNSLIGITYESDLRGCQPTGNGFECSLSSNAFETYKRQNSNYQQTFNLQKAELSLSHETERVNEITSAVVNTVSATAMGAIAGGAIANAGAWNSFGASAAGAITGGITAGATVGVAQGIQVSQNDKLRQFEKNLQQQNFDLQIGTIKNIPNSINRISSFNEIILNDFWYIVEIYECSDYEKELVDDFINNFSYGIGVLSFIKNFYKNGWFLRSTVIRSSLIPIFHNILSNELSGGIYFYEQI